MKPIWIKDFQEHPDILRIINDLKRDKIDKKQFSDVLDNEGNQYVDLVLESNGVLLMPLLGFTYVLEQMNLRFMSLAGNSIGSMIAILFAGLGDISQPKSGQIIDIIRSKNLFDFFDGNNSSKDFIMAYIQKTGIAKYILRGREVIDGIFENLGLNPGNDLYQWISHYLNSMSIRTMTDLEDCFGRLPGDLVIRPGIEFNPDGLKPRLAIMTLDLTTESKIEFPRMASLYWSEPDKISPAIFVRAAVSIPYFFSPLKVTNIPNGPFANKNWAETIGFLDKIPKEVFFIDNTFISNFPINVFHKEDSIPRLPTFGVRLAINRNIINKSTNPLHLFHDLYFSLRNKHDFDAISRNPDYRMLVSWIDIGEHNWMNFGLSVHDNIDLFRRGVESASLFLRNFDWIEYKKIRKHLCELKTHYQ
jgi:NTE family protein